MYPNPSHPPDTITRVSRVRILHTSDWHVGRTIRGRSRAEEHRAVLAEIAGVAAAESVDLVLVAGDLFDAAAPTPEAERIVYSALLELAELAPVVLVAGNHDHPRRLQAVAPLLELGRVTVGAFPAPPEDGGVVEPAGLPVRVGLIPFISQRAIVSAADLMGAEADQHGQKYAERLAAVVARLCADLRPDTVNLVVAHLMVHGGVMGGGERSAHTVFDYSVPALAFPGHLSYVALGHLHRAQRIPAPAPVWYSGSPLQLDFGEADDRKVVLVVEAEPGLPAEVREVPLTSGRQMVRLRGTLQQVEAAADQIGDAYLRVELDEPARAGLVDEVRELLPNAVDVVLTRRGEQIDQLPPGTRLGRSPGELFAEYLAQRGVEDRRLLTLFDRLLAEVQESETP